MSALDSRAMAAGLAMVMALTGCSYSNSVKAASVKPDKERKPAPEFALKDADGKTVRLSDYRGKVVLLDFWATWCGPCQVEIPWFMEFERKHKDKGFAVIGVSMDEDGWAAVKPFVNELKINYRIVIGSDSTADLYGGVSALPTTFLIDREGKVASIHVGLSGKRDFEDDIQQLLQSAGPAGNPSVPAIFVRAK